MLDLSSLLQRIRIYDLNSYEKVTDLIERIRQHPDPFLENIIPLSHNGLKKLYLEYTSSELEHDMLDIFDSLQKQDTKDILKDIEDFLHKSITLNSNAREAMEKLTQSFLIFTAEAKTLQRIIPELLNNLGYVLGERIGYSQKSSDRIIKELIVNLENYTTTKTGSESNNLYDNVTAYADSSHITYSYPSKLDFILKEMFKSIRKLILPTTNDVKDINKDIFNELTKTLSNIGFRIQNTDQSLLNLIKYDFRGKDRINDSSTQYSGRFSGLEALAYMVAITKHFGYNWNATCPNSSSAVNIIGENGGFFTVGDSITALRSKNDCTDLGSAKIFKEANILAETYRNGNVFKYDLNTPALCLLEGNSKGDIICLDYNSDSYVDADPIYAKTLPWVFGWLVRVLFKGEGPFYVETPTTYVDTWTTSNYKIKVRNGDFAGLGGIQNPSGNGTYYTIKEIPIINRQVSSTKRHFIKICFGYYTTKDL